MKQMPRNRSLPQYFVLLAATITLAGCGSGSSDLSTAVEVAEQTGAPILDPADAIALDPEQADLLDQANPSSIGGDSDNLLANDEGDLIPAIFPTETGLDLAYAQSGAALVEQLNDVLILPADIAVSFADCGVANAFYIPPQFSTDAQASPGGSIVLCHELTQLFKDLFGDTNQAFLASVFVLMHELGHALVNQLNLPVLGIEESYVDGMGAVFVGEAGLSEGAVLAGWFFFSQPDTPFFDTHRVGAQRLGDLACWGVGADPSLLSDPTIDNIAQQLIDSGRNCPAEYAQQLNGFNTVLDQNIRGGLGGSLNLPDL